MTKNKIELSKVSILEKKRKYKSSITYLPLDGCMHDSAGKFGMDNWTREAEEGRVEGKEYEEA